MAFGWVIEC